jgi:hypothetical protein
MNTTRRNMIAKCLLALSLPVVFSAALSAQDPAIRNVIRYRVKPDRVGDFRAAMTDWKALRAKAGLKRGLTVWATQTGPLEYITVSYYATWAEMDTTMDPAMKPYEADVARILARVNQCLDSRERRVDVVQPDLSLPRPAELPANISVLTRKVDPAKVEEYLALLKAELMPAVKKSGMKLYVIGRTRFGGPANQFVSSAPVANWAQYDSPSALQTAMGQDAWQKFNAKVMSMTEEIEYNIYRLQPELTYAPAK